MARNRGAAQFRLRHTPLDRFVIAVAEFLIRLFHPEPGPVDHIGQFFTVVRQKRRRPERDRGRHQAMVISNVGLHLRLRQATAFRRLDPQEVIVRAIGPSLPVTGPLADPVLELYDENGALIRSNDNWRSDQSEEIIATSLAPTDDSEAAIIATLSPALYTAIVRGVAETTGVALVEVYSLN